ncbi:MULTISPECIES: bluetail domain-containing putative surface protein [unclassified Microcoleus]|uniref:bluetail domain-containing putative surface protein n=1 Tax=unclassified Microcoleus TaxID=2642155 RepID=UPI002FD6029F
MFDTLLPDGKNLSTSGNIPSPTASASETTNFLAETDNIMDTNFSSDRVIAKLKPTANASEITNLPAEIGVTKVTQASQPGTDIWQTPSGTVEQTISAYKDDPRFEYIDEAPAIIVPSTSENLDEILQPTTSIVSVPDTAKSSIDSPRNTDANDGMEPVPLPPGYVSTETIIGSDDRQRVTDTQNYPWSSIGLVQAKFPNGEWSGGTGSLIGPFTVLTAGHVIYSHARGGWATEVKFTPGRNGKDRWFGEASYTSLKTNTSWINDASLDQDWGVIQLDRPVGNYTGSFGYQSSTANINGQGITTAGYPSDLATQWFDDVGLYRADGTVSSSTATRISYNQNVDVIPGQSGSPVWQVDSDNQRRIKGVVAYSDLTFTANFGPRIQSYMFDLFNTYKAESAPVSKPDLVDWDNWFNSAIGSFSRTTVSPGQGFSVNTFARNNGTEASGNYTVNFYASTDDDVTNGVGSHYLLGTANLSSLSPFNWADTSWSGTFPNIPVGTYRVVSFIDPTASIGEYDESLASNQRAFPGTLTVTPPPPVNDNFVNRSVLSGSTANATGTNVGATGETGEPAQNGTINSAWWSWTAPSSGTFTIDTKNSNFDTYLSVFTGSAVDSLSLIGSNDDGGGNATSLINLNATAGTTYQIAVDGFSSATGAIQLNIAVPPPANDNFANSIALTGSTANGTGSNIGATGEVGEPSQSGTTNSAWWSWTAPSTGTFEINTVNSNFDTWLSVFTGSAVDNLTLIDFDDQGGGNNTSLLSLNATAGTTYQIAVDGYYSATGEIQLNIAAGTGEINGTPGADNLTGTPNPDTINGLAGNDTLNGLAGNDTLDGGDDNDRLNGGPGADQLTGGLGNDIYVVDNAGDVVTELPAQGTDLVQSGITYTLGDDVENLTLMGIAGINGTGNTLANILSGNPGNNTLNGLAGNDTLNGAAGNDILNGNDGNDRLNGGPGADQHTGGLGNDIYVVDNAGDVVSELPAQGTDLVQSGITYTLGADVENLTLTGTALINGTGNPLANVITGNAANNILTGGGGLDQLRGGLGNDIYVVNNAGVVVTELAAQGTDEVRSTVSHTLAANVETLRLTGTALINGTGNTLANTIVGNTANNRLNGGGGQDILTGSTGADTFVFKFGESSVSARDSVADFAIGTDKIDLLTQAGAAMNAPSSFSRAADNSTATTLQLLVDQVLIDANGGLAGNQALGINSAAFVGATNASIAGNYLVINDATAGFQASSDLVIKLTTTGTFPPAGSIPVTNFFV